MLRFHVGLFCLAISRWRNCRKRRPAPGLLGHWKFDAGQATWQEDLSGNGNFG